jgi:SAM-dependent methyltransferase
MPRKRLLTPFSKRKRGLGSTFDTVAERYDRFRPGYPEKLVDGIIKLSRIPRHGSILEIGCGTGKATVPFARRGYRILAIDPGRRLVAVAKRRTARFPGVRFVVTTFEKWKPGRERYDLVIAASSYHWLDPRIANRMIASVLKPGGWFASFGNCHHAPSRGFHHDSQRFYREHAGTASKPGEYSLARLRARAGAIKRGMRRGGFFHRVVERLYPWTARYSVGRYLGLLGTFSEHIRMRAARRQALFRDLKRLADTRYGGKVTRENITTLWMARRKRRICR